MSAHERASLFDEWNASRVASKISTENGTALPAKPESFARLPTSLQTYPIRLNETRDSLYYFRVLFGTIKEGG